MRLIDADALAQAVKERVGLETGIGREINDGMVVAYAMIAMAPTLALDDLRPKGRWVHDYNNVYGCSECMGRDSMSPKKLKPYCPNCGADMQGGVEYG